MKILYIETVLQFGGKERRLVELLKTLSINPNIDCHLILLSDRIDYIDVNSLNITLHILKKNTFPNPIGKIYKIFKIINNVKPEIIHSWGNISSIYSLIPSVLLGIPMLTGSITNARKKYHHLSLLGLIDKIVYKYSKYIIANTYAGIKEYKPPPGKAVCIHNGFNFERLKNLPEKQKLKKIYNIKAKFVVCMNGTFREKRDYNTFINAAIILIKQRKDLEFIAIGDGPNFNKMQAIIPENLRNRIKLLGEKQNIEELIKTCDIGVHCTNIKIHLEGISNSILEFMALGIPVIATEGGGTNEIVLNNKTGYLIKPADENELELRILQLIDNQVLRMQFGEYSKSIVETNFSNEKMIEKYMKLYKITLGSI